MKPARMEAPKIPSRHILTWINVVRDPIERFISGFR